MTDDSRPVRRRRWPRIALALLTTACVLALAETAHRVWRSANGWPYDGEAMRDAFLQGRNFATQAVPMPADAAATDDVVLKRWVLDPYEGFDFHTTDVQIENELTGRDRSAGTFTILVLGGSVAAIFSSVGREAFVEALAGDARFRDKRIEMWCHARGGYKQPQQVNELVFLLALGLQPNAVINIDGFNEVALGNDNAQNGIHPLYPSRSHWLHLIGSGAFDPEATELVAEIADARHRAERTANLGLKLRLWRSSVLGTLVQRIVRGSLHRGGVAQIAYARRLSAAASEQGLSGPPIHGGAKNALPITVEGWAQTSASMQAICAARGIPYMHVLQPTLHDEGAKPVTAQEREGGNAAPEWMEGVRAGYPLLRERGARLRSEGVNFVDASRIFADVHETLYYDVCHFGKAGNEIFARFVAREFLQTLPVSLR